MASNKQRYRWVFVASALGFTGACSRADDGPPPSAPIAANASPAEESRRAYEEHEARGEERARLEQQVMNLENRIVSMQVTPGQSEGDAAGKGNDELTKAREDLRAAWGKFRDTSDADWSSAKRGLTTTFEAVKKRVDDQAASQR